MMQHGECRAGGKLRIGEGHKGGIAIDDLNIGVAQPGAQGVGKSLIGFNCGEARHGGSQAVRSEARAGTGLEHIRTKIGAGEHPGHPPHQRLFPTGRAAEPVMQLIQGFPFARTVATCSA